MLSYPSRKDQIYHGPHYYTGMESIPTHMYVNLARPPMCYGYWPWGSSYGGVSPLPCPDCYNHSYLPARCAWGSPYSHVTTHHCPGNYPSFPVQCMPPTPYYAMEQPQYEYEKNVPREHHCCGCLNHPLHHKEHKNVRIEEEKPERERRTDDSVVPYQFKNLPYPIVWLPPEYNGNKEQGKFINMVDKQDGSRDVKANDKDSPYPIVCLPTDYISNKVQGNVINTGDTRDGSRDAKANENETGVLYKNETGAAQQPTFWNGWIPLDSNNLALPKNTGDGDGNQRYDGKRNFPFPLFWIPYNPEEKEIENYKEEKDSSIKPSLESEKGSNGEQNFYVNRENIGDRAATKARDIPVKEVEHHVEKETSMTKEKERDGCDVVGEDNGEKKFDNGDKESDLQGSERKSSSPPRPSKLPPVCLRVDPLPRRKNGNGSSRSSSPSSNKKKADSQTSDASKVFNLSEVQAKNPPIELKEDKGTETIEVVDGRTSQGKTMDVENETPVKDAVKYQADVSTNQVEEKPKEEHITQKYTENDAVTKGQSEDAGLAGEKNEGSFQTHEMKAAEELTKSCKTKLSEEEAVVIIQSAYRGFDVRRWEPIKKLKQIAKVREQIADVKHFIQALKSSSDIQDRSKHRNIVAETIMSLLLNLDAVQGLTSSIREVRKSVARELVSLQEQLDSLMNEESDNSQGHESMKTHDEDALKRSEDVITSQPDYETTPTDVLEAHQNQIYGGPNNENSQIPEADLIREQASEKIEKEATESSMNTGVESAPEQTIKKIEKSIEVLENDEMVAKKDREDLVLGRGSGISPLQEDFSAMATDITESDHDMVVTELELPIGVHDAICAEEDPNDVEVIAGVSNADQAKQLEEALVGSPIVSEPLETTYDEDSCQPLESHEVPDIPFNMVNVEQETEENCPIKKPPDNCKSGDKSGTEEVDGETGDARIEPADCTVQQLQNFIAHMIEASDKIGNYTTSYKMQENSGATDSNPSSALEEYRDAPTEKEMLSHLQQVGNSTSLINECANSDQAKDMMGVEEVPEAKRDDKRMNSDNCITQQGVVAKISDSGEVSEDSQPQITQACQQYDEVAVERDEECNVKQAMPTETLEQKWWRDASADEENNAIDPSLVDDAPASDVVKTNQKLIEENERLREMMENLIKSGQEQLTAISSLSGRVKDLEKKLSRKKKLKVKQYRGSGSGSS